MLAELRGDYDSLGRWYETMVNMGAYNINNVMMHEELPDVPGGDVRRISLNYIPLHRFDELSVARNVPGGE
jgi:hypothetical protein